MKLFSLRLSILFIFMAVALPVIAAQPQPLKVVVSIKPLHLWLPESCPELLNRNY